MLNYNSLPTETRKLCATPISTGTNQVTATKHSCRKKDALDEKESEWGLIIMLWS